MSFIGGLLGGTIATRLGMTAGGVASGAAYRGGTFTQRFFKMPLIHGGQFGVGYTSGAYGGYGVTNTADPFGIHKPKYKYKSYKLGMPYGYGYGRRRYRRRYSSYGRYSGYKRYNRYSRRYRRYY